MKHIFILWKVLMVCLLLANPLASYADFQPSYSTAGFYSLPNTGRTVYDMNPAWRFYKGIHIIHRATGIGQRIKTCR